MPYFLMHVLCRSKFSELLAENDAAKSEAERYKQHLRHKEQELESTTIALADEQVGDTAADRLSWHGILEIVSSTQLACLVERLRMSYLLVMCSCYTQLSWSVRLGSSQHATSIWKYRMIHLIHTCSLSQWCTSDVRALTCHVCYCLAVCGTPGSSCCFT